MFQVSERSVPKQKKSVPSSKKGENELGLTWNLERLFGSLERLCFYAHVSFKNRIQLLCNMLSTSSDE